MMVAILLVAFGTILAAGIAFKSAMAARRSTATLSMDQSLLVAEAAEALAAYALRESKKAAGAGANAQTHVGEAWAQPLGPVEVVPGIVLEAYVQDETARFNLNSLVNDDGVVDPIAVEKLEDLMEQVGIERKWASVFADWIDTDTQPLPNGAEDSAYAAQDPPYRAPNTVVTSTSELLALPEFGRERYVKLAPFVTALPRDARINICTASGPLLDSLVEAGYRQYSQDPELLAKEREQNGCFPALTAYQQSFSNQEDWTQKVQPRVKETSDYFRLTSIVTIGSAEFTLYSLLWREPSGQVRVMMRSFSPD
jgi:general secretion pathway protein K